MNIKTHLDSGYLVSTVSLGPGRYETMVFPAAWQSKKIKGRLSRKYFYTEVWAAHADNEQNAKENHLDAICEWCKGLPFHTEPVNKE